MDNLEFTIEKDHSIILSNNGVRETYSLKKAPDLLSTLVVREKSNILHQMDLKSVIQNLDNSVDLLNVAYHAVYGFDIQTDIWELQKTLMDLNDKGINVIDDFSRQSTAIITELISFFDWLTKGAEKVAINKLDRFSSIAASMSKQAQELAEDYKDMATKTSDILKETIAENNRQYANQDKLKIEMNEFQSEQEAADIAKDEIKKRLTQLHDEYEKLSKAELDSEKHQRTMDIMGAVFGFLGSAMTVAAEATGKQMPNSEKNEDDEKLKSAQQDEEKEKEKVNNLKSKRKELTNSLESSTDGEKETIRVKIRQIDKEIEEANLQLSKKSSILKNIADAFKNSSSSTSQSSAESLIQENRSKRLMDINKELIRLEEEQTKQLSNLAKYTKRLEGMVIEKNSIEAAVRSLIVAVSCLKNVVVAVMDIALFWTSMEKCCKALVNSSLKNTINDLQGLEKEERIEYYYTDSVMIPLLNYMAQWSAIRSVSLDFINAAEKTRFKLNDTIKNADKADMGREDHWDLASKTASKVAENLDKQVAQSKAKTESLRV